MKANEAPDKIYVSNHSSGFTYNWHPERLAVKDIEYIHTDAFIEKACSWLENNLQGIVGGSVYIEDFRKYMKGE